MRKNIAANVDEYIARFPKSAQRRLRLMRAIIRRAAPQAEEKISYGIPTFTLDGNLVYFGGFKGHVGFFPTAAGIAAFKKALGGYEMSKGTVRFPFDRPLPAALITRMVRYRVAEQTKKRGRK